MATHTEASNRMATALSGFCIHSDLSSRIRNLPVIEDYIAKCRRYEEPLVPTDTVWSAHDVRSCIGSTERNGPMAPPASPCNTMSAIAVCRTGMGMSIITHCATTIKNGLPSSRHTLSNSRRTISVRWSWLKFFKMVRARAMEWSFLCSMFFWGNFVYVYSLMS